MNATQATSTQAKPSASRPRLLQVVLSLNPGGTERLVIEMTKRLLETAEVHLCCLDEPGLWAEELTQRGVGMTLLERKPGFTPGLARKIAKCARDFGAQAMHCHHYTPFVYGALAGLMLRGVQVVYTEHGRLSDAPPTFKRKLANQLFGRLPCKSFAVSRELRGHMIAEGFPASSLTVNHNGIEPGAEPDEAARVKARAALGVAPGDVVLGSVARLDPVKDLGTLIEAFTQAAGQYPSLRLLLVGEGPQRDMLRHAAEKSPASGRITFLGQRKDVRQLLPGFDMYINSSITEGISVTILEAMAAGLPVIATNVGGNGEVVDVEHTGLLVGARRPQELAKAMLSLAGDPQRRQAMSRAARRRLEESFTLQAMLSRYTQAYGGAFAR